MPVTLELTVDDARFLQQQLTQHTREVQNELAHTSKRELQHALASDLSRLQQLGAKLDGLLHQMPK